MLYFLVGEQLYLCQSRNNLALPAVDSGTAEFAAGSVVEQRFTTEVQRLEQIELHAVINCVGLLQKACSEQGDLAFLINAYCRTGWNGVTTVELARVVDAALDQVSIRRVDGLQMNKSLVNTRADSVSVSRAIQSRSQKCMTGYTGIKSSECSAYLQLLKLKHHRDHETFDVAVVYNDGLATWYAADTIMAKKSCICTYGFLRAGYDACSERSIYQKFQMFYFGSAQSRQHFVDVLPEFSAKTGLLPNYVDKEGIRSLSRERCEHLNEASTRLVTVSRLSQEKGVEKFQCF